MVDRLAGPPHTIAMTTSPRWIAHIDMDAFFASVELLRYPDLKGLPVVVGGSNDHQPVTQADGSRSYARLKDYVGRGVVTTSTYPARALGVFSGMGMMKAAKLAPDAILLPADFPAYRHYSQLFKQAVAQIAPHIENVGIDEIYVDISELSGDVGDNARTIQAAVYAATGLTCSIGVSAQKRLAKVASDLRKPNGITIVRDEDVPALIWPLKASKINGIGPKAAAKLASLGIVTVGDLAAADPALLHANFGPASAAWLLDVARGIDERPVVTHSEPKSMGRENTFSNDLHPKADRTRLTPAFTELCERVAQDLQRKGYVGKTVGVKLRFADFQTVTRDITLPRATDDAQEIRRAAGECLKRIVLDKRIRLLGVKVTSLEKKGAQPSPVQGDLFASDTP